MQMLMLSTFNNSCKKTIKLLLNNQKLTIAKKKQEIKNIKKRNFKKFKKHEKMVKNEK